MEVPLRVLSASLMAAQVDLGLLSWAVLMQTRIRTCSWRWRYRWRNLPAEVAAAVTALQEVLQAMAVQAGLQLGGPALDNHAACML